MTLSLEDLQTRLERLLCKDSILTDIQLSYSFLRRECGNTENEKKCTLIDEINYTNTLVAAKEDTNNDKKVNVAGNNNDEGETKEKTERIEKNTEKIITEETEKEKTIQKTETIIEKTEKMIENTDKIIENTEKKAKHTENKKTNECIISINDLLCHPKVMSWNVNCEQIRNAIENSPIFEYIEPSKIDNYSNEINNTLNQQSTENEDNEKNNENITGTIQEKTDKTDEIDENQDQSITNWKDTSETKNIEIINNNEKIEKVTINKKKPNKMDNGSIRVLPIETRCTLVFRDVPTYYEESHIRDLCYKADGYTPPTKKEIKEEKTENDKKKDDETENLEKPKWSVFSIKKDVNNTWFLTLDSEQSAQNLAYKLREHFYEQGKRVLVRIKPNHGLGNLLMMHTSPGTDKQEKLLYRNKHSKNINLINNDFINNNLLNNSINNNLVNNNMMNNYMTNNNTINNNMINNNMMNNNMMNNNMMNNSMMNNNMINNNTVYNSMMNNNMNNNDSFSNIHDPIYMRMHHDFAIHMPHTVPRTHICPALFGLPYGQYLSYNIYKNDYQHTQINNVRYHNNAKKFDSIAENIEKHNRITEENTENKEIINKIIQEKIQEKTEILEIIENKGIHENIIQENTENKNKTDIIPLLKRDHIDSPSATTASSDIKTPEFPHIPQEVVDTKSVENTETSSNEETTDMNEKIEKNKKKMKKIIKKKMKKKPKK